LHGRLVYVEGDRKASWLFLNLLRALLEAYATARTIHVILDNFIIHKSRVTKAWLAEFGRKIRLHFLPPTVRTRTGSSASGRTCGAAGPRPRLPRQPLRHPALGSARCLMPNQ